MFWAQGGRFVNVSCQPTLSRREIILSNLLSSHNAPSCRYRAAEVQTYLLQYTSCPLEAVKDAFTSLGKPQPHFHFDIHCEDGLASFRLPGSPDLFVFNSQIYSIWVDIVVFSRHRASNDKANNQLFILLQHASKDSNPGYWDSGSGGRAESAERDATLQETLKREVKRNTGLQLSEIVHPLPVER